jgi:hypothetical protein
MFHFVHKAAAPTLAKIQQQGDQIGRIFRLLGDSLLREAAKITVLLFSHGKI